METIVFLILLTLTVGLIAIHAEIQNVHFWIRETKYTKSDVQNIVQELCDAHGTVLTDTKTNKILKKYDLYNNEKR